MHAQVMPKSTELKHLKLFKPINYTFSPNVHPSIPIRLQD